VASKESGSAKTSIQVEDGSDEEFVDASEGLEEEAKEEMFPPEERGGNALRGRQAAKEKATGSRHRSKSADSNASANQSRKVPSRRRSVSPARRAWSSVASVKKTGFAPGVDLNNAGKTSALKEARRKAAGSNAVPEDPEDDSDAIQHVWNHKTFCYTSFLVKGSKGGTMDQVLSSLAGCLSLLQEDDPSACWGHLRDSSKQPIRKAPFPSREKDRRAYFKFHGKAWQFSDISGDQDRKLNATVMLYSDVPAEELFAENFVDLRSFLDIEVKAFQAVDTVDNLNLLLAPNDIYPPSVADAFSELLSTTEKSMIAEKRLDPSLHRNTLELWEKERFPRIIGRKLYPKGGPYVKKKKGEPREDSLHKMCIVFEYETVSHNRISAVLDWVKFNGLHKAVFGEFAVLTYPPGDDAEKAERDRYRGMLEDHGRCTRGYDVSSIPGFINAHYTVAIEITSGRNNEFVTMRDLYVHDLLRKVKVTMANGKRRNVIQCIFLTKGGDYNLWYPGNNAAMKAKAQEILANAAAYLKHQATRWGMNESGCMLLIEKSFDQYSARSAKSSRWDTKNQRIIAVNHLDFAGEDSRNFRENFLGIVGSGEQAAPAKATVVVSSGDKDGEIGNFDFNRDNASVNTIHTRVPRADDGSAATGFQTVANYNRGDEVHNAETVNTTVNGASEGGEPPADDATGFESRSYFLLRSTQRPQPAVGGGQRR
jgi:hypothetical protein